jgi:hypothetical protein
LIVSLPCTTVSPVAAAPPSTAKVAVAPSFREKKVVALVGTIRDRR